MYAPYKLKGTLMLKDTPLLEFHIIEGITDYCKLIEPDINKYPYALFRHPEEIDDNLPEYFLERLTPMSRQGLFEDLKKIGMNGYDPTKLLKYQNASCAHDCYWVRFKHGVQTWEELQEQIRTR